MFFPFEEYIHSTIEKEYKEDIKKKNNIVKYLNILSQAPDDYLSFYKFCNTALFFRNIFCKESFLYFFMNKFEETERKLLGRVIFDMFVISPKGVVGEHKTHFLLSCDLYNDVIVHPMIRESFNRAKLEIPLV